MDISLKNKKNIKILGYLCITILIICGIFLFVDKKLNGVIVDWFSNNYMLTTLKKDETTGLDILSYEPYWPNLKRLILVLIVLVSMFVFLIICVIVKKTKQKERKKILKDVSLYLQTCLEKPESEICNNAYPELEIQILRLKESNSRFQILLQQELQQKKDLITYLAHDLKTPLAAVIGYLDLLNENPDLSREDRKKCLQITQEKAERLEKLIEEFFDIIRYDIQDIILNEKDVDLELMINQVADSFFPLLQKENRRIDIQIENNIKIKGDPDKLARVFNNVLKNALLYSKKDTDIYINVRSDDQMAKVNISNYGNKIPEEQLKKIFTKFYRLDEARSTETGGAGLGLAIAEKIVLAHEGKISVKNENGMIVFQIELPLIA